VAQDTFTIAASGDDGSIYQVGTSYPTNGSITQYFDHTVVFHGRHTFGAGSFETDAGFFRWDTSSIPNDATITSASFRGYCSERISDDALSFVMGWGSWTPANGDFSSTPSTNAHAGTAVTSLALNDYNTLALQNAAANVNTTGTTYLKSWISQRASDAAPTGINSVQFASFEHATHDPPQLIVEWSTGGGEPEITRIAPDAILSMTNLSGAVGDVDDDPDAPDGSWLTVSP
jgi:hypothetical protein